MNRRQRPSYYPDQRQSNGQVRMLRRENQSQQLRASELEQPEEVQNLEDQTVQIESAESTTNPVNEERVEVMETSRNRGCRVRFFNAAAGYGELEIKVADKQVADSLEFGSTSDAVTIPEGYQNITIRMEQNPNAVLVNKQFPFNGCMNAIAAIVNTSNGVDVIVFNDTACKPEANRACFRVANLSYTSPPLDVMVENGEVVFEDIRFRQMTEFKQADAGEYNFNLMVSREAPQAKTNDVSVITPERPVDEGGYPAEDEPAYSYFFEDFEDGKKYTAFIIGNKNYDPTLRVETIEDDME